MKYLIIIFLLLSGCSGFKVVNEDGQCLKWFDRDESGNLIELPCPDMYHKEGDYDIRSTLYNRR